MVPVDASVNWTVSGASPDSGVQLNTADWAGDYLIRCDVICLGFVIRTARSGNSEFYGVSSCCGVLVTRALNNTVRYSIVVEVPCIPVMDPVDASVNWTVSGAFPWGVPMKAATGATGVLRCYKYRSGSHIGGKTGSGWIVFST